MSFRPMKDLESKWNRIRSAMERNKQRLEHGGYVVRWRSRARSGPEASVRFRELGASDKTVHRAIYLGTNEELMRRAQELLFKWQGEHNPGRSPIPEIRRTWCMLHQESRKLKPAHRRAFLNHVRPAMTHPGALWLAIRRWPAIFREQQLRSRGGRPRKGRLAG